MRFTRTPLDLGDLAAAIAERNRLYAELRDALQASPVDELAECFCAFAENAHLLNGGAGPAPGWNDPNADPETLTYECYTVDFWVSPMRDFDPPKSYKTTNMFISSLPNAPSWIYSDTNDDFRLETGRWYRFGALNWPGNHTEMFDLSSRPPPGLIAWDRTETGPAYRYGFWSIDNPIFMELWGVEPFNGVALQVCAALPPTGES